MSMKYTQQVSKYSVDFAHKQSAKLGEDDPVHGVLDGKETTALQQIDEWYIYHWFEKNAQQNIQFLQHVGKDQS